MQSVVEDYKKRSEEIEVYFTFVSSANKSPSNTELFGTNHDQLIKTFKANSFLLLYNLIESTVRNAIEAIFDEFRAKNVRYDNCRSEVQKLILSNLRKRNIDAIHPTLMDLSLSVVYATFEKSELFSGNVDARRIRETAEDFGFKVPVVNGAHLLTIKTNRNHLAHGDKSFTEIGRDFSVDELEEIKKTVLSFLEKLLESIESYLVACEYDAKKIVAVGKN